MTEDVRCTEKETKNDISDHKTNGSNKKTPPHLRKVIFLAAILVSSMVTSTMALSSSNTSTLTGSVSAYGMQEYGSNDRGSSYHATVAALTSSSSASSSSSSSPSSSITDSNEQQQSRATAIGRTDGIAWSNWKSEGGKFINNVDAKLIRTSGFGAILEAYAIGADRTLQGKRQVFEENNGPYTPIKLGGSLKSTPEVILTQFAFREWFAVGTDQTLHFLRDGNPNWLSLGGKIIGNPDAIIDSDLTSQRIYAFVVQADKAVWYRVQTGANTFTDWQSLGGRAASDPVASRNHDNRLEVFMIGTDGALYHRYQTSPGGPWNSNWESLGGKIVGNPYVAKNVDGKLQVFAVRASDHALIFKTQLSAGSSKQWTSWSSIGGQFLISDPVIGTNYDGRLEVFALANGNDLVHTSQISPGSKYWYDWQSLGRNVITSKPTAVSDNEGRIEVFGIGAGGALYHRSQQSVFGDRDGDLLHDRWELEGEVDINSDGKIDLVLPNSSPTHKDLYLEIDYMQLHKPWSKAISDLVNSFAKAPVSNPDRRPGINLHILVDDQIPHKDLIDLPEYFSIYKPKYFGTAAERSSPNALSTMAAKNFVYHYAIFAHQYRGQPSQGGIAEIRGNDELLTLGSPGWGKDPATGHTVGSIDQQEGLLMHEFGHNLNFGHGGVDEINCKPNYLSTMSYSRIISDLISNRPLDYSRSALNTLNENSLNENAGIAQSTPPGLKTAYGPPPVRFGNAGNAFDWNRNNNIGDVGVKADLNHLSSSPFTNTEAWKGCRSSPGQIENSYNDWNRVVYRTGNDDFQSEDSLLRGGITGPELPVERLQESRLMLLEGINEAIQGFSINAFSLPLETQQEEEQEQPQGERQLEQLPSTPPNLPINPQEQATAQAEERRNTLLAATAPDTSKLANLLVSDRLDESIAALNNLRSTADASVGGNPTNDLVVDATAQQEVLGLIDNLILALEKQK